MYGEFSRLLIQHMQVKNPNHDLQLEKVVPLCFAVCANIVQAVRARRFTSLTQCFPGELYTFSDSQGQFLAVRLSSLFKQLGLNDEPVLAQALGTPTRLTVLQHLLETLGFRDDMPAPSKHMDYSTLNLQSIRILNRLASLAPQGEPQLATILQSCLSILPVQTNKRTQQVQIMNAQEFFQRLQQLRAVKSANVKENLRRFLCIDEAYKDSLMFKKLAKALKDCSQSLALKGIGFRKLKDADEEEEYYDEEEEEEVKLPQPKQPTPKTAPVNQQPPRTAPVNGQQPSKTPPVNQQSSKAAPLNP